MGWRHSGSPKASESRVIPPRSEVSPIFSETISHFAVFVSLESLIVFKRKKWLRSRMSYHSQCPRTAALMQDHFGLF